MCVNFTVNLIKTELENMVYKDCYLYYILCNFSLDSEYEHVLMEEIYYLNAI